MRGAQIQPWLGEIADIPDIVTVTASTYTVKESDFGRTILLNSANAQTVTMPLFGTGFNVYLMQIGAGAVTVTGGTGVTLNGTTNLSRYNRTHYMMYNGTTYAAGAGTAVVGTTPVGTVGIQEFGDSYQKTTVLTLTNFIIGALPGAGANLAIGNIVYAFPAGEHLELGYSYNIALTAAGTGVAANTALGSVIGSGAVNTLAGTATFMDRLTQQAITTAAGGGTAVVKTTVATAGALAGIAINAAASVKNVFLNAAGAWNANNTGNLTATGTIILAWQRMS